MPERRLFRGIHPLGEGHIPLACAATPSLAAPLHGTAERAATQAQAQARHTVDEVARLVQAASDAPRAAAEVVAQSDLVTMLPASLFAEKIQFNRDVRPILSDKCFHCHGADASHRKGELRLDLRDGTKIVINSHRAARQIWMAADRTAWHFDPDATGVLGTGVEFNESAVQRYLA